MAPKVCVPADFGRHHIGAPSHGNLTFNLQEGLQIKANSIILSLNSPVIDELTTNLHLTSLEAEDFSREAVDCFIEASYTGEVEALNQGNFRDVNKMSAVFKVNWLADRCKGFFRSYLEKLDSQSSYSDLLFAVEEAVYLISALKKRDFLDLIVTTMGRISCVRRDSFINQYLSDLSAVSSLQIDACIAIVDSDVLVLVEILIAHIRKGNKVILEESTRYLFMNVDLNLCFKMKPDLHDELFSVLGSVDNVEKEDYKLVLGKLKQNIAGSQEMIPISLSTVAMSSFVPYIKPSNLNRAIDMLVASDIVDNLYKLIDGIWVRTRQCENDIISESVIEKLVGIKERKGWERVDFEYVDRLFLATGPNLCSTFIGLLRKCNRLVSKKPLVHYCFSREYKCATEFVEEIFMKKSYNLFQIDDLESLDNHFLLSTTPMRGDNPDSFTMRWSSLSETQPHRMPALHLALERWKDGEWSILPITWCGQPTCEPTRTTWSWGYIWFGKNTDVTFHKLIRGRDDLINWIPFLGVHAGCKYRFILFAV